MFYKKIKQVVFIIACFIFFVFFQISSVCQSSNVRDLFRPINSGKYTRALLCSDNLTKRCGLRPFLLSYKRLIAGYEAPVHICWARNNESALVRLPAPKKGKESSTRIEFRSPDPACNPYLAFSVMLAAGLKGVEEGYELPPEATNNIYEMTPEERAAEGIGSLPQSLTEAISAMEESELVAETLGEHVFDYFIRNKRAEWLDYKAHVTPWELDRYLGSL